MDQTHRSLTGVVALLIALLALGGCPAPERRPEPSPPDSSIRLILPPSPNSTLLPPAQPPPAPSRPVRPPRENHLSAATRSLVTQARAQSAKGDLDGASTTLDRALRIEPSNPLLWIERGRLRLAENDAHQAEACGVKALGLAVGDRSAQAQAGRLLADALRAQKRNPEASEIERQPYMR